MKKLGKFMFGALSLTTLAAGAYYVYKNYIKKDDSDDSDGFEDDYEDFETEENDEKRAYVPINLNSKEAKASEDENASVKAASTKAPEDSDAADSRDIEDAEDSGENEEQSE